MGLPRSRWKSYDCVKRFLIFLDNSRGKKRKKTPATNKSDCPRSLARSLAFDNSECSQFVAARVWVEKQADPCDVPGAGMAPRPYALAELTRGELNAADNNYCTSRATLLSSLPPRRHISVASDSQPSASVGSGISVMFETVWKQALRLKTSIGSLRVFFSVATVCFFSRQLTREFALNLTLSRQENEAREGPVTTADASFLLFFNFHWPLTDSKAQCVEF